MGTKQFVFALIAALAFGMAPLTAKIGLKQLGSETSVLLRQMTVATILFTTALFTGKAGSLLRIDLKAGLCIVVSGILGGIIGLYFNYRAIETGEVSRAVGVTAAYPLITFIFAYFAFGESFTFGKFFGIIFIIAGVILLK